MSLPVSNYFYSKYRKYKRRYLGLKSQLEGGGRELLTDVDFPMERESLRAAVGDSYFGQHFDQIWNGVFAEITKTLEYMMDRHYILYRYREGLFDRVRGKEIKGRYDLKLSVVEDGDKDHPKIYLKFSISKIGMEIQDFVFMVDVKRIGELELRTPDMYYRGHEFDFDEVDVRKNIDIEWIVPLMHKYWMHYLLDPPISNLVYARTGGRFGNLMFKVGSWVCHLVRNKHIINRDFIIGMFFVYGRASGRAKKDMYFEEDVTDFLFQTNTLGFDDPPLEHRYDFLRVEKIHKDESFEAKSNEYLGLPPGQDESNVELKIVNMIPRSLITHFCHFYVQNKNPSLMKLEIPSEEVALHFRGSDFCITHENRDNPTFFVLHFRYYMEAMKTVRFKVGIIKRVVIFATPIDRYIVSMMIEYLKYFFPETDFLTEGEYVENRISGVKINGPLELILLISKFQNIILSNSSFSFWCGYLSKPSSKVFAWFPKKVRYSSLCKIMPNAYKTSLKYLDAILENWIDVYLDPRVPCNAYLQPCYYFWKESCFSHLELYCLLYHVWYNLSLSLDFDEESDRGIRNQRVIDEILETVRSDGTFVIDPKNDRNNSLPMESFLEALRTIHKNKDRGILVTLIDHLYMTDYFTC